MSETQCHFVSSHGILKSCSLIILNFNEPNIVFNIQNLKKGKTLYLKANLVISFYKRFWSFIKEPIIVVSGNEDITFPEICENEQEVLDKFINEPNLIHWFSQNLCLTNPKCTQIPIGLDYHTLYAHIGMGHPWGNGQMPYVQEHFLRQIQQQKLPWEKRHPVAFCNWHFFSDRGDRKEVLEKVDKQSLYLVPSYQNRIESWLLQSQFAFVASPRGGGVDCHRTWEALCLGCVPIVKSTGMDDLYKGLPVWIVKDWSELTSSAFAEKKDLFSKKEFQDLFSSEKLSLAHWVNKINNYSTN